MEVVIDHFQDFNEKQFSSLKHYGELLTEWNTRVNLISRKDIANVYNHHILHSLMLHKFIQFLPESKILDFGSGGGLPGIPLAIANPETHFTLIDARSKKVKVMQEIIQEMKLDHVTAIHGRGEELKSKFDFVVTRAVSNVQNLQMWTLKLLHQNHKHFMPNGVFAWKGSDVEKEMVDVTGISDFEVIQLAGFSQLPYFEEKAILYLT